MAQFELETPTQATVRSINVRSEMHGADHVPAIDIGFEIAMSNDILSTFDGRLKGMLYEAAAVPDDQPSLEGVDPVSDLPKLRCSILGPLPIEKEYAGYLMTIDQGIDDTTAIEIGQCGVDRFKVTCLDGGTVKIVFRCRASGLTGALIGRVAPLLGQKVQLRLQAPEAQPELG